MVWFSVMGMAHLQGVGMVCKTSISEAWDIVHCRRLDVGVLAMA